MLLVIRTVSVIRVLKLIPRVQGLNMMMQTFFWSIPALFNVGSVLMLLMFIYVSAEGGRRGRRAHFLSSETSLTGPEAAASIAALFTPPHPSPPTRPNPHTFKLPRPPLSLALSHPCKHPPTHTHTHTHTRTLRPSPV